jgi:hypothetical protein
MSTLFYFFHVCTVHCKLYEYVYYFLKKYSSSLYLNLTPQAYTIVGTKARLVYSLMDPWLSSTKNTYTTNKILCMELFYFTKVGNKLCVGYSCSFTAGFLLRNQNIVTLM